MAKLMFFKSAQGDLYSSGWCDHWMRKYIGGDEAKVSLIPKRDPWGGCERVFSSDLSPEIRLYEGLMEDEWEREQLASQTQSEKALAWLARDEFYVVRMRVTQNIVTPKCIMAILCHDAYAQVAGDASDD